MVVRLPAIGPKVDSCPVSDLHTLPTATQLTQPVTTCVRSLVSYAGLVEQMAWLTRKSHRSSAPPNEEGRNDAHPSHSPGAVVPHAGPAVVGPPNGTVDETAGSGERETALRAAVQDAAFRAASRSVWPGTEDRLDGSAPATPQPAPGVPSFGPLGAALPEAGQPDRPAEPDARIWEPRRLYKEPKLRPRRGRDPGPSGRPGQQRPDPGTGPGQARSDQTAAPERQRPDAAAAQPGTAPEPRTRPEPGTTPGRPAPLPRCRAATPRPGGSRSPRAAARPPAPARAHRARRAHRAARVRPRRIASARRTGCASAT